MKRATCIGAILPTILFATPPAFATDCTTDGQTQAHDLTTFSTNSVAIRHCETADGKAAYDRNVELLKILNDRNDQLAAVCPTSDARWTYVRETLKIQTRVFKLVAQGCGGTDPS